jgi:hypothetical protein
MSFFDDVGKAFSDAGKAIDSAVADTGKAFDDAGKAIGGFVSDAAATVEHAVESISPGTSIGAVIGTVLLGPVGGVVGGAIGGAVAETPAAEPIADAATPVDEAHDTTHFDDEIEKLIAGLRGVPPEEKSKRRDNLVIEGGVNATGASIPLKPGEKTPVTVTVGTLAPNTNVHAITAALLVADATDVPKPETTVAQVDSTASEQADQVAITVATPRRPRNVTIELDGGAPFFSHPGSLTDATYAIPDFSTAVNAYLDRLQSVGEGVPLRFLVKSDTPGLVGITIDESTIRSTRVKMQTWTNEMDSTIHLDRALTVALADEQTIPLGPVQPPPNLRASLVTLSFDLSGTMGPERLLGDVSVEPVSEYATVSADYAVAQATAPGPAIACVGISARLLADGPARIYVELQPDDNGAPATGAPLARADLELKATGAGETGWTYIPFGTPGRILANATVWILLRGVQGSVRLALEAAGRTFAMPASVSRASQGWQPLGERLAATLRLVYLPEAENSSAALEVIVAGRAGATLVRRRVEARASTQNVSLSLNDADAVPLTLVVHAHARGTVSLANIVQEYALH